MTRWMSSNLRLVLLTAVVVGVTAEINIDGEGVQEWAKSFGEALYELSLKYSGAEFIRNEYKRRDDLRVERVDGIKVVQEMATRMESMLENKVLAVEKLRNTVEEAHERHEYDPDLQFEYFNSNLINTNTTGRNDRDANLRKPFALTPNDHFNDIPVNIVNSTVQVAANVYNFGPDVLNGIKETEVLNDVFQENYERDPTLTWQYFGHNTGFFRNYPGIEWEKNSMGLDLYDCRKRGWYISSATSPKDVVILIDTSGSMTGSRINVAKHTVNTIMKTLGDDDFFNVISFGDATSFIQPCFNGTLVQANADNKNLIEQGLKQMAAPKNIANFQLALTEAFELLESFNNTGLGARCNQAIMLITDGAHETYEELFDKYNEDRHVRVFTYLIGADIKDDPNVQWMSCNNKGYYTRIGALADVEENASKYIHVLSRPMVIEQDHITIWTNVYMDTLVNQGLQLMTTVSQPVFNKKESNREQGILLGVAGVDVPVKELLKLTPAYKLGVNGYPFAITNNGYILYHPDLRPMGENGELKPNYNSVDLAEVELSDRDEQVTQQPKPLRTAMVDRKTGYMNMTVRIHSKDMKRLHFRLNHYFYTDLAKTPFSLGIVMSDKAGGLNQLYGFETFTVPIANSNGSAVGDLCLLMEGLENLFNETEDTILANWIFCQLNNTEGMTMTRPQALEKYLRIAMENGGILSEKCDPELINHVIFDAKVTQPIVAYWQEIYGAPPPTAPPKLSNETLAQLALYQALCDNETAVTKLHTLAAGSVNNSDILVINTTDGWFSGPPTTYPNATKIADNATDIPVTVNLTSPTFPWLSQGGQPSDREDDIATSNAPELTTYNSSVWNGVVLSFVGTKGGLTRIFRNPFATQQSNFAEDFINTIEEEYYQRAAEISTDKFIYSVPLQTVGQTVDGSAPLLTASTAVLVAQDDNRSIAAAVGFQILSDSLRDMLMDATVMRRPGCNEVAFDCELTCYNESVDCYLLDEHGYIIISKEQEEIGMHFVSVTKHARVFDRMLESGIYTEIKQIDYQAMCEEIVQDTSAASHLLDPLISISTFLMGFTKQMLLLLSHLGLYYNWEVSYTEAAVTADKVVYTPCDKEITFYSAGSGRLPQTSFIQKRCDDCKKSYSMEAVPHSNLLLLMVDQDCTCDVLRPINLEPVRVEYNSSQWCERLRTQVHRRRPEYCHSQHPMENSTDCGRGAWLCPSLPWILSMLLVKSILTQISSRS
ncbi:voltage-dependent calcium channel subunit alpha-2/delta-3-like isoform X2 [Acanthaster planci]|uniref:Voltage-dependent calcium channel subunit alpha-2/delta-3-like isoform X2 n=1 Tax=Acanthaster planci TaxID=133434 RepID=A0A8B7YXL5_ACAPL|nr:voltage-dependent calcium channel subunit alpha-2/delta-3-like isoform X2 [Acanthaster planci]